jgi:hypothetical protein
LAHFAGVPFLRLGSSRCSHHRHRLSTFDGLRPTLNRLSEDFVAGLYEDFRNHGSAAIAACRAEKPDVYVRVIASLLPKDVNLTTRNLDDLSDDQLMRKLAMLTEMARPLLAKLPTVIDVTPAGTDTRANPLPVDAKLKKSST